MKRRIIEHNDRLLGDCSGKIVQASPQQLRVHRAKRVVARKLIRPGEQAENISSQAFWGHYPRLLAPRLPAVRHTRVEAEATFIPKIDLQIPVVFQLEQFFEFGGQPCILRFVLLGFEPFSQAVPGIF